MNRGMACSGGEKKKKTVQIHQLSDQVFQYSLYNLTLQCYQKFYACVFVSSTATWPLDPSKEEKQGWRHIRIKQMGKNASGQTHYLSLSGLELYGTITAVCEDQLGEAAIWSFIFFFSKILRLL